VRIDGPFNEFRITYGIFGINFINKPVRYIFLVAQSRLSGEFALKDSNYVELKAPIFITLSFEEIAADEFIRHIAQFLLAQKFSMLTADSRVIEIERDFPYYRFVFRTPE